MKMTIAAFLLLIGTLFTACATPSDPEPLSGTIADQTTGEPVLGARITVAKHVTESDGDGHFEVPLFDEADRVEVSADGYHSQQIALSSLPADADLQALDVSLVPYILTGTVTTTDTREPLTAATVCAGTQEVATDDQGRYTIRVLPLGTTLVVSAEGHHPSLEAVYHGEAEHNFMLRPRLVTIQIRDEYSGEVVPDVTLRAGEARLHTDETGRARLRSPVHGLHISADRPGYAGAKAVYGGEETISLELRPDTLHGTIRSNLDGIPLREALLIATADGDQIALAHTDQQGQFSIDELPASFDLLVKAPGYRRQKLEVTRTTQIDAALEPFESRGVYIPFGLLVKEDKILEIIDLVRRTELNTIVLDVKGDRAWLAYPSEMPVAKEIDAYANELDLMDVGEFLRLCQHHGIYTIARIVVFKDNVLAQGKPEWAIHRENGELWRDLEDLCWVDPFRKVVWDYNVGIAKEVIELGFDEVQFDYLRFPSDGEYWDTVYLEERSFETRVRAMRDFCRYAHEHLQPTGAFYSADLFGLTVWVDRDQDMGIGQRVEDIAPYFDYLSPMVYPSTFRGVAFAFGDPLHQPYQVVYQSCVKALERTDTHIRPWIQHYSLYGITYGTEELLAQKRATIDAGTTGWLFWNSGGVYDEAVFER